jgi:glycine cleavage system H lipoate-binding protein
VSGPDLINQDAENTWIIKVKLSNPSEVDALLSKADYDALPK